MPSKAALAQVGRDGTKTLCFSSSNAMQFPQRPPLTEKERGESMKDWFSIGKRDTKYMKVPVVPKHLPTKDSAHYRQSFRGKPAVDFHDNQELREMFAPSKKPPVKPKLGDAVTKYSTDFVRPTADQMRKARGEVFAAAGDSNSNRTMGGSGDMLVRTSFTQERFSKHGVNWSTPSFVPKDNLELPKTDMKEKSHYTLSFTQEPSNRASYNQQLSWLFAGEGGSLRQSELGRSTLEGVSALSAAAPSELGSTTDAARTLSQLSASRPLRTASCPSGLSATAPALQRGAVGRR